MAPNFSHPFGIRVSVWGENGIKRNVDPTFLFEIYTHSSPILHSFGAIHTFRWALSYVTSDHKRTFGPTERRTNTVLEAIGDALSAAFRLKVTSHSKDKSRLFWLQNNVCTSPDKVAHFLWPEIGSALVWEWVGILALWLCYKGQLTRTFDSLQIHYALYACINCRTEREIPGI